MVWEFCKFCKFCAKKHHPIWQRGGSHGGAETRRGVITQEGAFLTRENEAKCLLEEIALDWLSAIPLFLGDQAFAEFWEMILPNLPGSHK